MWLCQSSRLPALRRPCITSLNFLLGAGAAVEGGRFALWEGPAV